MPTRKHTHLDTVNSLPQPLHLPIDAGSLLHQITKATLHACDIPAQMLDFSSGLSPPIADRLKHWLQLLHFREVLAITLHFRERLLKTLIFAVQALQSAAQSTDLALRFLYRQLLLVAETLQLLRKRLRWPTRRGVRYDAHSPPRAPGHA